MISIALKARQEVFTHLDDTGKARTFPIENMNEFAQEICCDEIIRAWIPIEAKTAKYMRTNQGIEQDRIDRLADPYLSMPALAIQWPDDKSITIIDGSHRLVKLTEMGRTEMRAYIFLPSLWEQFLLPEILSNDLVKDGFLTKKSTMLEYEKEKLNGNP